MYILKYTQNPLAGHKGIITIEVENIPDGLATIGASGATGKLISVVASESDTLLYGVLNLDLGVLCDYFVPKRSIDDVTHSLYCSADFFRLVEGFEGLDSIT